MKEDPPAPHTPAKEYRLTEIANLGVIGSGCLVWLAVGVVRVWMVVLIGQTLNLGVQAGDGLASISQLALAALDLPNPGGPNYLSPLLEALNFILALAGHIAVGRGTARAALRRGLAPLSHILLLGSLTMLFWLPVTLQLFNTTSDGQGIFSHQMAHHFIWLLTLPAMAWGARKEEGLASHVA